MDRVRDEVGLGRLHAAAAVKPGELPPIDEQQLDKIRSSYSHLRPATKTWRAWVLVDDGRVQRTRYEHGQDKAGNGLSI